MTGEDGSLTGSTEGHMAPGDGMVPSQAEVPCSLADVPEQVNLFVIEHAYILEVSDAVERVVGRMEYHAQGEGPLDRDGLLEMIEQAVRDQLLTEFRDLQNGHEGRPEISERDLFLISGIGVRPHHARKVAVAYNALALKTRRAFFLVAVGQRELDDLVGTEWATPEEWRQDFLLALDILMGKEAGR